MLLYSVKRSPVRSSRKDRENRVSYFSWASLSVPGSLVHGKNNMTSRRLLSMGIFIFVIFDGHFSSPARLRGRLPVP